MYPNSVILVPDFPDQSKLFLFRNPAEKDIMVKIVTNCKKLRFEARNFFVKAGSYVENQVLVTDGLKEGSSDVLTIYVRPVLASNMRSLQDWIDDDQHRASQLAFKVKLIVSPAMFSAGKVLFDLPGYASLIEFEEQATNLSPDDITTCTPYDDTDANKTIVRRKTHGTPNDGASCEFVCNFIESIFPPAPAIKAHFATE